MTPEDLAAWKADEPPPGFAERVMAKRQLELEPPRWKMQAGLAISVGVAALAALAALSVGGRGAKPARAGAVVTVDRQTLRIGDRALAVAEAGSDVSYQIKNDAARVVLPRGDVFFRVEPGGPFVVATPAGDVEVKGTCFRVEVTHMMPSKQALVGAGIGAALTATVFVTVYEGKVLLANEHGKTELTAGQSAKLESGQPPEAAGPNRKIVLRGGPPAPPPDNATREELLARDQAQRAELQALRTRLTQIEQGGGVDPGDLMKNKGRSFFDPTKDELLAMAKNCEVRFDSPNVEDGQNIEPEAAAAAGLTDADRQTANAAFAEASERLRGQIRTIYLEATGNTNAPEDLTTMAMWQELQQKSRREDVRDTSKTLSAERAGLQPPPPDLSIRSPFERAMRLIADSGNQAEVALAHAIGPDKARALRSANGGWGARFDTRGCADGNAEGKNVITK